ncbi:hypothetical protein ACPOL_3168 [Acidisarcina polymorpha]|uniref:Uncharacterized protein n=1 Tax=Acidisarcina polymorpha TaxID=2211140 RepID=A0A2Z5FZW6_9BACT|nr:hypothetical protein ACPOL_3168 [Acidisarcina polymorpha]
MKMLLGSDRNQSIHDEAAAVPNGNKNNQPLCDYHKHLIWNPTAMKETGRLETSYADN